MDINEILRKAVESNASDILISGGKPPMLRINGKIQPFGEKSLNSAETKNLTYSLLSQEQIKKFEKDLELDCSYNIEGLSRFRINVYLQKGSVAVALRPIPSQAPTLKELLMPEIVSTLAQRPRGLILVAGPTGCGKSTTTAAIIDFINEERHCHIITLEDPIEFIHPHKNSVVDQREIGSDTLSFPAALKHIMRQNPDIIFIGEMRDLETIAAALTVAETGHLVLATLHTQDAAQTVDRIIGVFPPYQQQQIRMQLSTTLQGVICQQLIPRKDGQGRIAALEIMVTIPAICSLVREGKTHQIYTTMQTGRQFGMVLMDSSLEKLYSQGLITLEDACAKSSNPEDFRKKLNR